ncbi:phasin-related domain-containing protein [Paenibacillus antri]|uniref:phasin-related domain-containing protein n=1 Tax=Paenibacillus antri TaxID=2582848 RepID=UPI00192E3783
MMNDLLKRAISLGVGITVTSKERIEKYVDDLVRTGDVGPSESKELVARLVQRGEEQQAELKRVVKDQLHSMLAELRVATKEDVERLERRLSTMEAKLPPEATPDATETAAPPAPPAP